MNNYIFMIAGLGAILTDNKGDRVIEYALDHQQLAFKSGRSPFQILLLVPKRLEWENEIL